MQKDNLKLGKLLYFDKQYLTIGLYELLKLYRRYDTKSLVSGAAENGFGRGDTHCPGERHSLPVEANEEEQENAGGPAGPCEEGLGRGDPIDM